MVGLERKLRQVLSTGETDGQDILCQLLRIPRQLACVSEDVACRMLQMSGTREVPSEENNRRGGKPVVQTGRTGGENQQGR